MTARPTPVSSTRSMSEDCCGNCAYWADGAGGEGLGCCQRHAPHPTTGGYEMELLKHLTLLSWYATPEVYKAKAEWDDDCVAGGAAMWPATESDDWCGEFAPRRR